MLSKSKTVSVLSAHDNLQDEDAWALIYSCATDWWMLFPRKTQSAWVMSRKSTIDDTLFDALKSDLTTLLDGNYDVNDRWGSQTKQGGTCQYNPILTQQRIDKGEPVNE